MKGPWPATTLAHRYCPTKSVTSRPPHQALQADPTPDAFQADARAGMRARARAVTTQQAQTGATAMGHYHCQTPRDRRDKTCGSAAHLHTMWGRATAAQQV